MNWYVRRTPRRERLARKPQQRAKHLIERGQMRATVRGGDLTVIAVKKRKHVEYEVHGRGYRLRKRRPNVIKEGLKAAERSVV